MKYTKQVTIEYLVDQIGYADGYSVEGLSVLFDYLDNNFDSNTVLNIEELTKNYVEYRSLGEYYRCRESILPRIVGLVGDNGFIARVS